MLSDNKKSNINNHVTNKHSKEALAENPLLANKRHKSKDGTQRSLAHMWKEQRPLNERLMDFVVSCNIPFCVVEKPEFLALFVNVMTDCNRLLFRSVGSKS